MSDAGLSTLDELLALQAAARDWRLCRGDIAVLSVLLSHTGKDLESYPGPTRISAIAQLAKSNVKVSLEKLEQFRYIKILRAGERKKNRYRILKSPHVPSQKTARLIRGFREEQGLLTGPELGLRARPVGAGGKKSSGPVGGSPSGPADRSQLGLPAGHELSFNSPKELSCASRLSADTEDQEQDEAA